MSDSKQIQALHAAISRRDWSATEIAANALRDEHEEVRRVLAGTGIGSLPNDYPLSKLASEALLGAAPEINQRPVDMKLTHKINFEAWSRTLIGFIRMKGLEQELKDWSGGWPCPIGSVPPASLSVEA